MSDNGMVLVAAGAAVIALYVAFSEARSSRPQPVASILASNKDMDKPILSSNKPWGCVFIPPATAQTDWKYVSCRDRVDCESWCNSQTNGSVQQSNPLGSNSTWNPTTPTALPSTAFVQAVPLAVFR
jgi:hypothetical protein